MNDCAAASARPPMAALRRGSQAWPTTTSATARNLALSKYGSRSFEESAPGDGSRPSPGAGPEPGSGSGPLPACLSPPAIEPGRERHTDPGEDDLDQQFDPVDALGVGHVERAGDGGADEGGDDTDDDRQPDRDVLTARYDETAERPDDETDDDRHDDPGDTHIAYSYSFVLMRTLLPWKILIKPDIRLEPVIAGRWGSVAATRVTRRTAVRASSTLVTGGSGFIG